MGLFATMELLPNQPFGSRFFPKASDIIVYRLNLIDGISIDDRCIIASIDIQRHFMHPNVSVTDVECGRIRGKLYHFKNGSTHHLLLIACSFQRIIT